MRCRIDTGPRHPDEDAEYLTPEEERELMQRPCDCERGGNCDKVSRCELNNLADEHAEHIERIAEQVERIENILRNDKYKNRVRATFDEIDELSRIIKEAP